jgi:hypothetical protein
MKEFEEKLEMKVKDCYNTNTIFDKRKYVLLSDAKKVLNEALSIANVVGQSEQLKAEGRKEATEEIKQWLIEMDYEGLAERL